MPHMTPKEPMKNELVYIEILKLGVGYSVPCLYFIIFKMYVMSSSLKDKIE